MVFPGKLSAGCGLCRSRKVKCDEARPTCRRCAAYGAECPGYGRPLTILFHSGKERRRQTSPRSSKSPDQVTKVSSATSSPGSTQSTPSSLSPDSSCLIHQPYPSTDEQAISFFFHENYVAPQPGISAGHLEFLLELYGSTSHASCLRPSTLAAAYLSLSRHNKSKALYLEARKHYGQALRSVHSSLSKRDERKDVILSAIMILSLVEDIDGEVPGVRASHLWGISRLFEAEGYSLLYDLRQGSLCRWVFTQLTIYSFATNRSLPCLSLLEIEEMERNILHPTYGTILAVAKIMRFYSAADTRLKSWFSTTASATDRSSMLSIINEAMHLQSELRFWASCLPEAAGPRYMTKDGGLLITHSCRWHGSVWSLYLATLLLFYSKVMRCCQVMLDTGGGESPDMERVRAASTLSKKHVLELVETICGGIPYLLGKVDEYGEPRESQEHKASILYNMVWPLAVVKRCRFSTGSQVKVCAESLGYIGELYGLNLAYSAEAVVAEALGDIL